MPVGKPLQNFRATVDDLVADNPFPRNGPGIDLADLRVPEDSGVSGNVPANVDATSTDVKQGAQEAGKAVTGGVSDIAEGVKENVPDPTQEIEAGFLIVAAIASVYVLARFMDARNTGGDKRGA